MKELDFETLGDNHVVTILESVLRKDDSVKSDNVKIRAIQDSFEQLMQDLGLDLIDDGL